MSSSNDSSSDLATDSTADIENTTLSSEDSREQNSPAAEPNSSKGMMLNCCTLCTSVLLLVFSIALNTAQSPRPVVPLKSHIPSDGVNTIYQAAPPPMPFFPEDSHVDDSFNGSMSIALQNMEQSGLVFVMYYAPWSLTSKLAREEFSEAAGYMTQVPFVAINCWYAAGRCKAHYKFHKFPVLYVYMSGVHNGFFYNGEHNSRHYMRFVSSLLNPLTHIKNSTQFFKFVSHHDSSMLGYFNMTNSRDEILQPELQQFYYASLRSIETDYLSPVRFGVVSDREVARQLSIRPHDMVLVRTTQINLNYPAENNKTSSFINTWIQDNKQEPLVSLIQPGRVKSDHLSDIISNSTTVILFTQLDPCQSTNQHINLMREVAIMYRSCFLSDNSSRESLINKMASHIKILRSQLSNADGMCMTCKLQERRFQNKMCKKPTQPRVICKMDCGRNNSGRCNMSYLSKNSALCTTQEYCTCNLIKTYSNYTNIQECCWLQESSCVRRYTDHRVYSQTQCALLPPKNYSTKCDSQSSNAYFSQPNLQQSNICRSSSNTSLDFIAVDYLSFSTMAQELGLRKCPGIPQVMIVDLMDEKHYLLNEPYTRDNLLEFIYKSLNGGVKRHLVSKDSQSDTSHAQLKLVTKIGNKKLSSLLSSYQDNIVYYYTDWCLACKTSLHIYYTVAHYIHSLNIPVHFYSVNVDKEQLDYKLTPGNVPSIIFINRYEVNKFHDLISYETLFKFVIGYAHSTTLFPLLGNINLVLSVNSRHTQSKLPVDFGHAHSLLPALFKSRLTFYKLRSKLFKKLQTINDYSTKFSRQPNIFIKLKRGIHIQLLHLCKMFRFQNRYELVLKHNSPKFYKAFRRKLLVYRDTLHKSMVRLRK